MTKPTSLFKKINKVYLPFLSLKEFEDPKVSFKIKHLSLIMTSLTINLLGLALPIFMLQIYDRILVNQNIGSLNIFLLGISCAVFLDCILRYSRSYVINWAASAYEHATTNNVLKHIVEAKLSALEKISSGQLLQNFNAIALIREFFSGQALLILLDLPFVAIYISLIYYLAQDLAYVPLGLLCVFAVLSLINHSKKHIIQQEQKDEVRMNFIIEILNSVHTLKALGLEETIQREYEYLQKKSSLESYHIIKKNNASVNQSMLFSQLMILGILAFGTQMVMSGEITLGALIACILLSGRIMNPIQRSINFWEKYQLFQIAAASIDKLLQLPRQHDAPQASSQNLGEVSLKDITLTFDESENPIFKNLNLSVKRGESISISGGYANGKTTLLKLISGLYTPQSGDIKVNGIPPSHYSAQDLMKNIGYMAMEGAIFRGTIRENLTSFGQIPESQVTEIMKLLDLDSEISILPEGFETKLEGCNADPIPPGLKQRIAIARVLAYKPRIILFDNADRALDKKGYNQVYRLLARLKGKATLIIITDDRNILRLANTEFILSNKKLIEKTNIDDSKIFDIQRHKEINL